MTVFWRYTTHADKRLLIEMFGHNITARSGKQASLNPLDGLIANGTSCKQFELVLAILILLQMQ